MKENEAIEVLKDFGKQVTVKADGAYQSTIGQKACNVAIEALTNIQQHRALEKRLTDMFGGELSLEDVTDELERYLKEPDNPHPVNAKILTYEDAADWDAYRAIGTPEECLAWKEKQTAKKIVRREATDEDIENELREFITRKGMIFQCPTCGCYIAVDGMKNCWDCGQKLDWSDKE